MTVTLAVAIQHHPSRAALIPALLERLSGLNVEVVTDPDPDGQRSPWRCYRACLDRDAGDATHVLIIQDDAEPCEGFADAALSAIEARPDKPIAFFVSGGLSDAAGAMTKAAKERRRWVDLSPYSAAFPCVASSWPAPLIPELLAWSDQKGYGAKHRSDDGILVEFLRHKRIWPLATVPCLVQHPDVAPSLNGARHFSGRVQQRVAVLKPPDDAATIDWKLDKAFR